MSHIQYIRIFKCSPLPGILFSPDAPHYTIQDVNDAFLKITGTKGSDLIGKGLAEAFPHNEKDSRFSLAPNLRQALLSLITTGKGQKMDIQRYDIPVGRTSNLVTRYWDPENIPIPDAAGKVELILHVLTDVTEKILQQKRNEQLKSHNKFIETGLETTGGKLAGETLKELERLNSQALINNTEDLMWSVSPELKLIASNLAFIRTVEAASGIILKPGDDVLIPKIFPDDFLAFWKSCYNRALSGESFTEEVHAPVLKTRDAYWTETAFNPIFKKDEIVGVACYSRNISERKSGEEQLRQSELRLTNAQAVAKIGSWETDLSTFQVIWSKETFRIFDIEPHISPLTYQNFLGFIHPDDIEKVDNAFKNSVNSDSLQAIEHRIVTPNGLQKIVEERWHILCNKQGEPERAIGTCQDITERKKTQQLISEGETKYRAFFENSIDGILLTVTDGDILAANPAACEMFRMTEEEIISVGRYALLDLKDPRGAALIKERQLTGRAKGELSLLRKDGTVFPAEISSVLFKDSYGEKRTSMIIRDITAKKQLESALETERKRFLNLFKQAPSSIAVLHGPDHVFEMANPLYLQLTGRKDIIGKTVRAVFPEVEGQGFFELLDNVYKTGEPYHGAESLIKLDTAGEGVTDIYTNFIYQPFKNADNRVEGIFFFANDVTEQVLSRKKIEESGKRYRQIVETAQEGIWLIDEHKQTTFINKRICDILGYTAAEMLGKDLFYFMDDEGKQIASVSLETQKKSGADNLDFKFITKTGTPVWAYLVMSSILDEQGNYIGGLAMVTDITERRKIDESNKFQATLLNTIGQAAIATDMQGKINFWNKAASAIYGWTEEEVLGKNIIEMIPSQQTKQQAAEIMQELARGNPWAGEFMVRRKDGSEFTAFVTNAPIYDQQNQLIGIIGVSSDITNRKLVELQLKESNERYNLVSQVTNDMVWDWDLVTGKVYRNKEGWKKIFRTGGQVIANGLLDDWDSKVHPEDIDKIEIVKEEIQNPIKDFFEVECRVMRNDGTYAFIHDRGNIIRNKQGKAVRLIGATQDITKRKEAELQVAKSELRFRSLVQNSSDLTSILDKRAYYIYCSPAVKRVLGYEPEFMVGKNAFAFIYPGDINSIKAYLEKKNATTNQKAIAFRYKNAAGEWRWLESKVSYLSEPGVEGYIFNSRDITERKLAEENLISTAKALKLALAAQVVLRQKTQESEARLKEAQSIAHLGHWELNFKTNMALWSDEACRIYGLTVEENMQSYLSWLSFIHPEDLEDLKKTIDESIHSSTETILNHRIILRDGTVKYIATTSKIEYDETGAPLGLYGISYDITERKLADIRLNNLNAHLQQQAKALVLSNLELEQFAYVASHDLQEPLRMVTSFLSRLEKKYGAVIDDRGKQYIDFAVDGAKRMRQIILDLLEFSRVGKTEDKGEDIDLNEVVDEIKILFRKKTQEIKAEIISVQLPHITGYRPPIRQVFQNLVGNALKYSAKDRAAKITITCTGFTDRWQFAVSDNGIGIGPEYFEKIFIIFQRLHTKEEIPGTGMGLAITKKIIENQGGKIWVESEAGKGSTFYFTLLKNSG